ncbi:flagellar export chaperone FlgN [Mucisphaera calidilacus]|uniref:FlgN protein n=1 Tax=Mucisphaera calidilacus TaxID=2527982 RepID=A0A518BZF3_9BACT|nr:flagellar export chaperone FlgN [Mucisphaera calidilacus]QDU72363.1 FlgN protein [Mucisphaera calidilacus]
MDNHVTRCVTELEALLISMIERQRLWLAVFEQKTGAMRRGDRKLMAALTTQEKDHLAAMGEMEKRRLMLLGELTQVFRPDAREPMRLVELAQLLPEATRDRLLRLRQDLRAEMKRFREQLGSVRQASESILRHVNGVMETVVAAAAGVATYTSAGRPPQAARTTLSTFSMTA